MDYRIHLYDRLVKYRLRISYLRRVALEGFRSNDGKSIRTINRMIKWETGFEKDYTGRLRDTIWMAKRLIPDWSITDISPMGEFWSIRMTDTTGVMGDVHNRWINPNLCYTLVYTILAVYLIDINRRIQKITEIR